jgi:aspartyl-tRNA(Asn)/glutamyl-tRNA(Gln) amidotransferase subunit A
MSDAIAYTTIRELGARYRTRELSPVEVTQALLARIAKLDPALHAFVTLTADRALSDARTAETALARGDARPLLGIPIAHKDIYCTRGIRTTGGSALLADWVPDEDATCVRRWQEAGVVLMGKLITHEFAFGIQFPGHRFHAARNPWNLDHVPGGSSSGSGAALAAGLVHGATGSDTGGSIRGPAAFCGIVGLKPTYGRSSRAGVLTLSWTLDHTGPMARTVEDCAYLMQPLAGHDPADPASSRAPVGDYVAALGRDVRGLKIGVPRNYFFDGVDAEIVQAFEEAMATLKRLGAEVRDVRIPTMDAAHSFLLILLAEAYAYHERDLREHP